MMGGLGDSMQQTRIGSFIEALSNVAIGFIAAILSQIAIFPWFDIHVTMGTHAAIGAWFTMISIIRGYAVRRWFNKRLHKAVSALSRGTIR